MEGKRLDNMESIRKAVKGDEEAFVNLLAQYREHLYKCAYYYLGNKEDAMDAIQETAYRAYKNRKSLIKGSIHIKAWLTRILINYCRDISKSKGKVILFEDISRVSDESQVCIDDISLDNMLLYDELRNMKPPYKEVIILRFIQDMKIKDIAEIMKKPESTIKSQIQKGIKMLRKSIIEESESYAR